MKMLQSILLGVLHKKNQFRFLFLIVKYYFKIIVLCVLNFNKGLLLSNLRKSSFY
jgi:hypothetical protein